MRYLKYALLGLGILAALIGARSDAQTLLLTLDTLNPQDTGNFGHSVAVGDVDGDGKADIAIGAPAEDAGASQEGRVYVFSGADGSVIYTLTIPSPYGGANLGANSSLAIGDVDGDGKADIAVAAAWEDSEEGRAYVFSGADGSLLFSLNSPNLQPGALFGLWLAVDDVNGDGKGDIAAGALVEDVGGNVDQGRAYVFSGADGSLLLTLNSPNPQQFARFGKLAVGDVDGDGKADIAVGASDEDVGGNVDQGRAYVFSGADGSLLFTLNSPNPQQFARFGYSLAIGDANGDGRGDIAVGAHQENVGGNSNAGRTYVFSGVDGSLLLTLNSPSPQTSAEFGQTLAVSDMNGDGKADIAVGAPVEDVGGINNQGRAYVFSGVDGALLYSITKPSPERGAHFAFSLAAGDVDGDGKTDIVAGAPSVDGVFRDDGQAYVFCLSEADTDGDSQGLGDAFGLFFRDCVEVFLDTLPSVACAATPAINDEDPDALGPDWDDSQDVDGSDVFLFAQRFGTELGVPPPVGKLPYIPRFDIYPTAASLHKIDGSDLFVLASYYGNSCP